MSKTEILAELPRLRPEDRLEIFERLCVLQAEENSLTHQQWVVEALRSGPALPGVGSDWEAALEHSLERARRQT